MNSKGFTILEVVISSAIFFIIIFSATNLLLFSSASWMRLAVKQELLENSRAAMDFLISHIRTADEITLVTDANYTLKELRTTEKAGSPSAHTYRFTYDTTLSATSPRYHRLEFGGNELASYVNDIQVKADEDEFITITIITDSRIEEGPEVSAQIVTGGTGLRYKKVKVRIQ